MKLSIRIIQKEDGVFMAYCPSLPGCRIHAPNRRDALEKLDEAIRGYVAAVNNFVPETLEEEIAEA